MISVNIATHEKRKELLPQVVGCLRNQSVEPDVIRVYYNDYEPLGLHGVEEFTGEDLTDRAKFKWVDNDEIYLSCDDDLYYPNNYIKRTLKAIQKYPNMIVTYHGRLLAGKGRDYYRGHKNYTFMSTVNKDASIDVPGTGVMAFDTRYFKPDILQYDEDCMVDCLIGLEAAKSQTQVVCLAHDRDWIRAANVDESIYNSHVGMAHRQQEICDRIFDIKHK
jgi:hypothetical protein